MSERVTMPALGESVTEGTVTRWLKNVGDKVEVDEPLQTAVCEPVIHRRSADVRDPHRNDLCAGHRTAPARRSSPARPQRPPNRTAADAPADAPSSWNPHPW